MEGFLKLTLFGFLMVGIAFSTNAQDSAYNGNPDTSFEVARQLAFNSEREKAQDTLLNILTKYPDYHDIRSFLASTYSWDGAYDKAKKEFNYILKKQPKRHDAWVGIIKNELWSDSPYSALELAKKALEIYPENHELIYLKASAQDKMGRKEEALYTLKAVIDKGKADEKFAKYYSSLSVEMSKNKVGLKAAVDVYSDLYDPMQYYQLKYVRLTKFGGIHAKLNVSHRFSETGAQFEVDIYPRIAKGLYAYGNFGWSNSFLYPKLRYGVELYKSLPWSLEASLGMRGLKFSSTTNIYTGAIGWYFGNNYLVFRTYVTPGDPGASKSGALSFRKYRADADNYFSVQAGMGFSPDNYTYDFDGVQNEIVELKSQKVNFGYYFSSKNNKNAWGINGGVMHQESSFEPGEYFWIYSMTLSWQLLFK
ncbi:MAG: hypothetical protein BM564_04595 [Bacteroidetes bacterium MedPE-SWsnd-G2]|nr:MAG: hypothetical protein BM564_04595 [Bacteroidetes bacterium MedPE-SWsnd-G2]